MPSDPVTQSVPVKVSKVLLGLFLLVVAIGATVLISSIFCLSSPKANAEKWLGMKLPRNAVDTRYWYQQPEGSYHARLACRFQLSKDAFLTLMKESGIEKVEDARWPLPTNFSSDRTVTWWNPPSEQPYRFHHQQQNGWITFVWSDGFVYAERVGDFGSMWGPHDAVH